jgi:phosphoribosylformylglycinamidine cyclo-ligase
MGLKICDETEEYIVSQNEAYKSAGVDIHAGYKSVELIKESVKKTHIPGVITDIGGFGGLFELMKAGDYKNPVLVSGTDGVGTKLKIAFLTGKNDTVGRDCVAMCVNDIACSGAKPLFFLDYLAVGKNYPEKIAEIVKGVSDGCILAGCALVGGETAEMPGFYPEDEYDLAGFSVGIVDKDKIIDGKNVTEGDAVIGVASSGVHSNGYSLIRKIFGLNGEDVKKARIILNTHYDILGESLGDALITPTKIYVKPLLGLTEKLGGAVKAVSHITGGGFYENIPRMLPGGFGAAIKKDSFPILPVFKLIAEKGGISEENMFNTYNMGIGLAIAVSQNKANEAVEFLNNAGEKAYIIGNVEKCENIVRMV